MADHSSRALATVGVGSISHGTMRPEDLIPAFADVLDALDGDGKHAELVAAARSIELADMDAATEQAGYVLEALFDALDEFAPDGCYFGAHEGDGSDYGFWPVDEGW